MGQVASPRLRLGIDLGGTKIEIAALDAQGAFVLRQRVATPQGDYAGTLRAVADLVVRAEQRLGTRGLPLGIGIPGSLSPLTGRVRNANSTVLNGRPLREDLQRLLARPVRLENDANCLALSEATDGAGAGAEVVFAVILGTGVGAGIAFQGRVLHGCNGIAGEWGHNRLPPLAGEQRLSRTCWCGRPDCVEAWLSGPALAADHAQAGGGQRSAEQVVAAMRAGDALAAASFERYARRLALALAGVINVLD
ncbi:MAG TPA: ROK family protein, partial [Ottowia sp.]|nr:ROK family protein [Ottowia sp.]